jgi:lon-related putative ATP-dependent protease
MIIELSIDRLRRRCDPNSLDFDSTAEVQPASGIIGQQRAVESLRFGLGVQDASFHVFVAGPPGTGRTTAVESFLHDLAKEQPVASDWCYVNNFTDTSRPLALRVEAGSGRALAADVDRLIARAREEVPKAMDTDEYQQRRQEIRDRLEARRQTLVEELSEEAGEDFLVSAGPLGVMVTPLIAGRPLTEELSRSLSPETLQEAATKQEAFAERVKKTLRQMRTAAQEAEEETKALNREVVEFAVGGLVDDLNEEYREKGAVSGYLQSLREALTADEDLFSRTAGETEEITSLTEALSRFDLRRYQVNVLVDRDGEVGSPVVVESNPTYGNLFGAIEREARFGALHTDFTLIKPGALHRANGGYLVLPARDLLLNYLSYDALKRALRTRELDIEEPSERLGLTSTRTLRPAPIPLEVKVVLIGTPLIYHLLYVLDEDFPKLFKVKAQFDDRMDFDEGAVRDYAAFLAALSRKEGILPVDREAVAAILEHASRLVDDQTKLTTRFDEIADVVREAAHIAALQEASSIQRKHVSQAIDNRILRSNLIEERLREMVDRGVLHIQTTGEAVGQINGLSVVDLGDYAFGRPDRITASVALGQAGVIDIEREARLGGPVHTKGVMIISGYLADRFAHDHPLSLSARVVFEQTYGGVEGDSASAGELLALLSRLSGVPIRQGVAITGSVDQHGRLQAVGGLNEKIEGFFAACRSQGLDGNQGVVIPATNRDSLMLHEDVVEAVRKEQFHVWAAETVEEAVEVTMGPPAGSKEGDSPYPEGSVYRLVDDRLREMAESLTRFVSHEPYQLGTGDDE